MQITSKVEILNFVLCSCLYSPSFCSLEMHQTVHISFFITCLHANSCCAVQLFTSIIVVVRPSPCCPLIYRLLTFHSLISVQYYLCLSYLTFIYLFLFFKSTFFPVVFRLILFSDTSNDTTRKWRHFVRRV